MNKGYGIKKHFIRTLFLAVLVSVCTFGMIRFLGIACVNQYFLSDGRHEMKIHEKRDSLQHFINTYAISSAQAKKLHDWQKENPDVYFDIYLPETSLYDSTDYEKNDVLDGYYYDLSFSDCTAKVYIFWPYFYKSQTVVIVVSILVASGCFLVIVLLFTHRLISRIKKLEEDVSILEGGGIDYEIHPDGNDEITSLAYGLEQMRQSFRELISRE